MPWYGSFGWHPKCGLAGGQSIRLPIGTTPGRVNRHVPGWEGTIWDGDSEPVAAGNSVSKFFAASAASCSNSGGVGWGWLGGNRRERRKQRGESRGSTGAPCLVNVSYRQRRVGAVVR